MKKQKFNNKNTKKYYHQLYTTFPLHNVQEKKFLTFFKTRLHEYERQYPDCSYQDYIYIILDYLKILSLIFIITTIIIMLLHI